MAVSAIDGADLVASQVIQPGRDDIPADLHGAGVVTPAIMQPCREPDLCGAAAEHEEAETGQQGEQSERDGTGGRRVSGIGVNAGARGRTAGDYVRRT